MFAGYVLPEAKIIICGRLTESPLQISLSCDSKIWRFPAILNLKVSIQITRFERCPLLSESSGKGFFLAELFFA